MGLIWNLIQQGPAKENTMSWSGFSTFDDLPDPRLRGRQSLEEILASRRSARDLTDETLTNSDISQLLWATLGVTDSAGLRTAPSAGALYPLELYVVQSSGVYHFEPARHELTRRHDKDLRQALHKAALGQDALIDGPAVFVITAVYARTKVKYGARAERYVHMEAGHAAQNLLLQTAALNLGGVPIGAFNDDSVCEILGLPENESPLYLIPIGHPR
jgi:SagB-type dehydrogenase family enzyme